MNRDKQLVYCGRCTQQKFDFEKGIICSLTNERADFEEECPQYERDEQRAAEVAEALVKRTSKGKSVAITPFREDVMEVEGLNRKQTWVLAHETMKDLDWNIGAITESELLAYTEFSALSWGEEIRANVEFGSIILHSECTGSQWYDWGRNRKNIESFKQTFNRLRETADIEALNEKYNALSNDFARDGEEQSKSPLAAKSRLAGLSSIMIPVQGYFITPILIILNILFFAVMIISGVHMFLPSHESLLLWGANFRPMTLDGQWWRLITNTFMHIGIFHLLLNMYALLYIGVLLEPILGKGRYLTAYLLSGLAGSLASLYWNELTISAGASGAIFGMYGVFLALLSTNLIEKSARKSLLVSIGVFVAYNLVNGFKPGIDNAAHIGGLLSGLVIGYAFMPSLNHNRTLTIYVTNTLLVLGFVLVSMTVLRGTNQDVVKFNKDMQEIAALEERALRIYQLEFAADRDLVLEIQNYGLPGWNKIQKIIQQIESYDLPEGLNNQNKLLGEYCSLRIKSYTAILRAIQENTNAYEAEIIGYNEQIEKILVKLNQAQ
ncbi:MAG TPA: rhomboid family intramembrane serine protease [Bacteroidales bacterium]|nr:rhomboid family intramembrane serine protease [Bacteroidales bacterium]